MALEMNEIRLPSAIGLFQIAKIRLPEIWQRIAFCSFFRLHGKGHKKSKWLQ
jgi:hypothetical protein